MEKKLYRSPNSKICGVCAGIADYFNIDPCIVRIIACLLLLYTVFFPMLIAYFIMAAVIPKIDEVTYYQMYHNTSKPLKKGSDKKIAGVCSGFAEYFGFDATILRLIFVLAVIVLGAGVMAYIVCAICMPSSDEAFGAYSQNPNVYNAYRQNPNYGSAQGQYTNGYQQNQNYTNAQDPYANGYQQPNQNAGNPQAQNPNGYQPYQYGQPGDSNTSSYNAQSQAGEAFEKSDNFNQDNK